MKKNIFKKLSFVLALAMLISCIAPAAGVFAAAKPALNATTKYLHLSGIAGPSEYDFNVSNKQTGWKYAWSSANENVASVDAANGVTTATGVGSTKVTVKITNSGKAVATLSATVVVRDNIETVKIANTPEKDLAVGEKFDFNRTFVTESGSTVKTSSVTRWFVNSDKATVDNSGNFVATEAGEYEVTAKAFQSSAKYEAYVTSKDESLVLASDKVTVKVAVGITGIKLVTPTQLQVTFDSSVKTTVDDKSDVTVSLKLDGTYTAMVPVASLDSVSADGKVVTVSTYDALVNGKTYKVTASGATSELAAQIGTPVSISMENQTAAVGTYTVKYTLLDQYGVNVASLYTASVNKSSSIGWTNATTGTLTLTNGQVAFVSYSYDIIKADGTIETISTGTKTITGAAATYTGTFEWNLYSAVSYGTAAFTTADKSVAVNESPAVYLNGRGLNSDSTYNYVGYKFESMSQSIAVVDSATGKVTPIAAGTALIKVTDANGNVVTYFNLTVTAEAATSFVKASNTTVKLSNGYEVNGVSRQETTTVDILNVDQYATERAATIATADCYVANATRTQDIATISFVDANTIRFTAVAGKSGSFVYVVKTSEGKSTTINVTVATPGALSTYAIDATQTSVDSYITNADTAHTVDFTVYGVDANGYKKSLAVTGGAVTVAYSVAGPVDFTETLVDANVDGTVTFDLNDRVDTGAENGTYTFKVSIGGIVYSKTFTVTNSRPAPEVNITAVSLNVANGASLTTVLEGAIDLEVSDVDQTITSTSFVSGNTDLLSNAGTFSATNDGVVSVYVKTVTFTNTADGATVTADVYKTFTFTVQ